MSPGTGPCLVQPGFTGTTACQQTAEGICETATSGLCENGGAFFYNDGCANEGVRQGGTAPDCNWLNDGPRNCNDEEEGICEGAGICNCQDAEVGNCGNPDPATK